MFPSAIRACPPSDSIHAAIAFWPVPLGRWLPRAQNGQWGVVHKNDAAAGARGAHSIDARAVNGGVAHIQQFQIRKRLELRQTGIGKATAIEIQFAKFLGSAPKSPRCRR